MNASPSDETVGLAALLDAVLDQAAIIDGAGIFRAVNASFLHAVASPMDRVVGRPIADIMGVAFHDARLATFARAVPRLTLKEEGWTDCGPLGRRFLSQAITALPGAAPRFLVVTRDLTAAKIQERALAASIAAHHEADAYHAVIVDRALDAIVVIDETGAVIDFNPSAVSIFGYSKEEALGCQIGDLIIPTHLRAAHDRGMKAYLHSGESRILGRRLEMEARRADGTLMPIELTITEVRLGPRRLFAAHLRDLTPARDAAMEIERQREALHQKDKLAALGSLLAGVAHELNNPLSIVLGQAMMLGEALGGPGSESVARGDLAHRSARIEVAAQRCARIVRGFLDMARKRQHKRRAVHLADLVEGALDLLRYTLTSSGIVVETDLPAALPLLWLDGDQIHQVIVNLLINAQQALQDWPDGQRRIRISAVHDPDERVVRLRIADSGPGIDPAIRSRIFDPYFTTKPQGFGTGIGLAVCRGLATSHDGALDLDDAHDQGGACFVLCLPVGPPKPAGQEEPGDHEVSDDRGRGGPGRAGRCVLIIDDEAEIAALLVDMVAGLGFRTLVARDGDTAKAHFADGGHAIDAILCDVRMPGGDGPAFHRWLVGTHPAHRLRIGFVTGDTLGPSAGRFLAETGCPVVEKPFTPDDISRILATLMPESLADGRPVRGRDAGTAVSPEGD